MKQASWPPAARLSLLTLLCAALAACGGGSGSSASDASADAASQTGSQTVSQTAAAAESADALALRRTAPPTTTTPTTPAPAAAAASGYFVDATSGSDSNAGSSTSPFKTLARLATVRLAPGQGIWLRCGRVWRESLYLNSAQLVDGSTIGSYGSDCSATNKPRITGADDVSGAWVRNGNVWSRSVPGLPKVPKLFVNGVALRTAQWPNFGGLGHEYTLTASDASASTTVIRVTAADRAALVGKDLAGASAVIRTEPWMIETAPVSGLDANGVVLRSGVTHAIEAGEGFVLQNKLWMLDAPGEFFHDEVAGRLYVIAASAPEQANLNTATVEAIVRDAALGVSDRARVSISKLALDMARHDGLVLNHAPAAIVSDVDASNNIDAGLRVNLPTAPAAPARGAVITGSRFAGNGQAGIDAGNAQAVDILNSTVAGTGIGQAQWANAAVVAGDGATVEGNVIRDSAFRGILFSGFKGSQIRNNLISNYCQRLCGLVHGESDGPTRRIAGRDRGSQPRAGR